MTREEAKEMAKSRDCHCINGKDRDNNYDECIDKIFDWHEEEVKKLTVHPVSKWDGMCNNIICSKDKCDCVFNDEIVCPLPVCRVSPCEHEYIKQHTIGEHYFYMCCNCGDVKRAGDC